MINAVIFDLDGVIVSTDHLHYLAWKTMADKENIHFDQEINHRLRGVSRMESLSIILENAQKSYTTDEKTKLAEYKNQMYVTFLNELTEKDILPYAASVISKLKLMGIQVAIGSSSKNAKRILKQIHLDQAFNAVADGNDIKHSKPEPDVFLCAANILNVSPEVCVVVEDAIAGIEAAKRAGMIAVAIGDAQKSSIADARINDLSELIPTILMYNK